MSTQYDDIGAHYDTLTKMAPEQIEHYNAEKLIEPYLPGARVLELACGLGRYTRRMLDMGAASSVAIDISSGMIESAKKACADPKYAGKIDFRVADCQQPQEYYTTSTITTPGTTTTNDQPFDLVLAAWLLNYAPDLQVLTSTFRNASTNLKPGGIFVGAATVPTDDPAAYLEGRHRQRPKQKGIIWTEDRGPVADGIKIHVMACTEDREEENVQFDCYHLRREVYDRAAREGGFSKFEWKDLEFPEKLVGDPQEEFLRGFVEYPEAGVFIATK